MSTASRLLRFLNSVFLRNLFCLLTNLNAFSLLRNLEFRDIYTFWIKYMNFKILSWALLLSKLWNFLISVRIAERWILAYIVYLLRRTSKVFLLKLHFLKIILNLVFSAVNVINDLRIKFYFICKIFRQFKSLQIHAPRC